MGSTATLRFGEKSDYTEYCGSLLPHTGEKSDYIEGKYCYSQINLRCALQVFLFMGLLWAIKMARAGWEGPLI